MNHIELAQDVFDCEIEGLTNVRNGLGDGFLAAVSAILECLDNRGKVVITGMGKNLHIAQKISATLASTGTTSVVLNPTQAMHGDLGILQAGDVLLALSYSGESDEILVLLPLAKRMQVTLVAVTGVEDSTLAKHSDIILPAAVEREACPFNMAPTSSTTATLALGDALAMVLLKARGFEREDYAKLHPSGAIGRALLLRVCDIMRTGARIATVGADACVKDALLAMTEARAGSAGITDDDNRLLGIFTDGDLRRHIGDHANVLSLPISTLMTANPLTVREDDLAVDVLKIFEDHNIDDLLVVDAENRVVGAVDIQDLPKLKIM
jgi:arabinose-5-phosphate isomerase